MYNRIISRLENPNNFCCVNQMKHRYVEYTKSFIHLESKIYQIDKRINILTFLKMSKLNTIKATVGKIYRNTRFKT